METRSYITAEYISDGLNGKQVGPNQWAACCPNHNDRTPSLHISNGESGRILLHCKKGCSYFEVSECLRIRGLMPESQRKAERIRSKTARVIKNARARSRYLSELWDRAAGDVTNHPYARLKGIWSDFGARRGVVPACGPFGVETDCLMLQMFSWDGCWCGLELIDPKGRKRAVGNKGIALRGMYPYPRSVLHVVEGWATAHAILEDFPPDHAALICFGCELDRHAQEAVRRIGSKVFIHAEPDNKDYWDIRSENPVQAAAYVQAVMEEVSQNG